MLAAAEDQGPAAGLDQAAGAAERAAVGRAGPVAADVERDRITYARVAEVVGKTAAAAAGKPAEVERRDRAAAVAC